MCSSRSSISSLGSLSLGHSFSKPHFFDRDGDGWICNVCTPTNGWGDHPVRPMALQEALSHERDSLDHARNVDDREMWGPPQGSWVMLEEDPQLTMAELKERTRQVHVDQVRDMVPFWIQGVIAAEKGESHKLEEFLDTLAAQDRWGISGIDDPWGPSIGPWPADHPWGEVVPKVWNISNEPQPTSLKKAPSDPWGCGAEVAFTESAHVGHRKGNHQHNKEGTKGKGLKGKKGRRDAFTFVEDIAHKQAANAERKRKMHDFYEMPTHEKVKKIEEMVRNLRTSNF